MRHLIAIPTASYIVHKNHLFQLQAHACIDHNSYMMSSSTGNIIRVTGPLCGEFTGHRWIPLTTASDKKLWCFLWSAPEHTVEKTIVKLVIWDVIALKMTSL